MVEIIFGAFLVRRYAPECAAVADGFPGAAGFRTARGSYPGTPRIRGGPYGRPTGLMPCPPDRRSSQRAGAGPGSLAGPGGRVDHRHALAVGQHRQRRRLILTQPGLRARILRVVRGAGQRLLKPLRIRAEQPRGIGAGKARRTMSAGPRQQRGIRPRGWNGFELTVGNLPVPKTAASTSSTCTSWYGTSGTRHALCAPGNT